MRLEHMNRLRQRMCASGASRFAAVEADLAGAPDQCFPAAGFAVWLAQSYKSEWVFGRIGSATYPGICAQAEW